MPARRPVLVAALFVIFFVISLLTNIIGPLVPDIIRTFHLSLTLTALLPFSFFAAYAVMSVPAGMLIERTGEKSVMLWAFGLALAGSVLFSLFPFYRMAILSLFLIGLGMAALQVAINPLLRVAGGEEHFAFNAVIVQFVFGLASFLSPLVYSYFALQLGQASAPWPVHLLARVVPGDRPWISMYWIFSLITLAMILLVAALHLPKVVRNEDERTGALVTHLQLLRRGTVWLFFLGIFAYVGLEQGLSNWMSQFLSDTHGFDPQRDGALAVSRFWGAMTFGCLVGMALLKLLDSRLVLLGFTAVSILTFTTALFGTAQLSYWSFPATGFAISVMWSVIFSLALNSVKEHHGTFSGILCTGIVGGALVPLLIGAIGDGLGLRAGLMLLYLPLAYIFSIGIWARPLVANKVIGEWQKTNQ